MAFQGEQIFFGNQVFVGTNQDLTTDEMEERFLSFLKDWTVENNFVYRDAVLRNCRVGDFFVKVNINDFEHYEPRLATEFKTRPFVFLDSVEKAARRVYMESEAMVSEEDVPTVQVQFVSGEDNKNLRQVTSDNINQLINVQGTVISAQRIALKGKKIVIKCKKCGDIKQILTGHGLSSFNYPGLCQRGVHTHQNEGCPLNPYEIQIDECEYVDFQKLKIQESAESMPVGEIPRTFEIHCENYLVDRMIPGNKINLTGIYSISEKKGFGANASANVLKVPYIYVLGFENFSDSGRSYNPYFSPQDINMIQEMSKRPDIFELITSLIAPSIYGHEDIKSAIACQLFGGSSKILPDKTRLRGDINILLMGDPSTAKSQLLKFVHKVFPVCIYTSGKGSSAAGLTAAIIKDNATKEFHLEGGALVLADGGIVCIDEFDKMRTQDRVAIHEAMEQQTISIAKAGITTILNSRTAILAAANPIFGSFNDLKSISDQIDLQTTILSRFDCIFIVRDLKRTDHDMKIADHVLRLHTVRHESENKMMKDDFLWIRKYITYARTKVFPRLSDESSAKIQDFYVESRNEEKGKKEKGSRIPITVRQLEAIIRLSEAIAKVRLSNSVSLEDTKRAIEIFKKSTSNARKNETMIGEGGDEDFYKAIQEVENHIRRTMKVNSRVSIEELKNELKGKFDNEKAIERAILSSVQDGSLMYSNNGNALTRKR